MNKHALLVTLMLLAVQSAPALAQRQNTTVRTTALSGQAAPGAAGRTFTAFGAPRVDHVGAGQVMFPATLSGSAPGTVDGLWAQGEFFGSPPQLLAARGGAAPGVTGSTFASFGEWTVNSRTPQATFAATASNGVSGVWRGTPGNVQLLAAQGQAAPGDEAGSTFTSFSDLHGSSSASSFRATVNTPGGSQTGIWWGTPGALRLFARTGQVAPGAGGSRFASIGRPAMMFTELGQVAFQAALDTPGPLPDQGIWWGAPQFNLIRLHRSGDMAPSTGGAAYNTFDDPRWSNQHHLSFRATLRGLDISTQNDTAIFAGEWDAPRLVARTGSAAPGVSGARFSGLGQPMQSAGTDVVSFLAQLSGDGVTASNDDSVWSTGGGGSPVKMLAREGLPAPGAAGAVFSSFETPAADTLTAFVATLSGAGVDASNDRGVWVGSPFMEEARLILREGDALAVAPGDLRVIRNLTIAPSRNPGSGESSWGAYATAFAFAAEFTDGSSGVFTVSYIPEPAAALAAVAASLILARPHRRDVRVSVTRCCSRSV